MRAPTKTGTLPLFAALATALALVTPAAANEQTREGFVSKAEPICKANTNANMRILRGARQNVNKGRFALAARQFVRAAAALERTSKQLRRIPQPPADRVTLRKWLSQITGQVKQLRRIAAALRAKNRFRAQSLVVRLTRDANLANGLVAGWGFDYCRFKPSRFT